MSGSTKGRKSLRTDSTKAELIRWIEQGATIEVACEKAQIGERTYYQWLEIAAAVENDEPHERMPHYKKDRAWLVQFAQEVSQAHARARVQAEVSLTRLVRGLVTTDTTTETFEETRVNPQTGALYTYRRNSTRTTRKEHPPNVKALDMYLSRRHPEQWSPAVQRTANMNLDITDDMRQMMEAYGLPMEDFLQAVMMELTSGDS